jgi:hypothetical protein
MFYQELSCPGEPGIGFDFEFSIRMWSLGQQVGLYSANWTGHIGAANATGTRADEAKWQARRRMEMRNNGLVSSSLPKGSASAALIFPGDSTLWSLRPVT